MNFIKATRNYEKWLGGHIRLVQADLTLKHDYMADSFFAFFREHFIVGRNCGRRCARL